MAKGIDARARQERQTRVSSAVWGLFFILMGVLFMLDLQGRIDLGGGWRYPPGNAIDGSPQTRWSSAFSDPQWIALDLGAPAEITRVRLHWEKAYATAYRIETSDDGATWSVAKEVSDGDGGLDEHELRSRGRYLRIYGTRRATPYGYSLFEIDVDGTGEASSSPGILSRDAKVTASSTETNYHLAWFRFWPVLLIASGLPLVLAPKDGGEQVFGLLLAGVGGFFQLQRLGLVSWSFAQVWPVVLVAAGLLLVAQALRQSSRAEDSRSALGGGTGVGENGR